MLAIVNEQHQPISEEVAREIMMLLNDALEPRIQFLEHMVVLHNGVK